MAGNRYSPLPPLVILTVSPKETESYKSDVIELLNIMKRILLLGSALLVLLIIINHGFSTTTVTCYPHSIKGDANGDGMVTPGDVQIINDIYYERIPSPSNICCVDLNDDGQVTPGDAQLTYEIYMNNLPYTRCAGYCGDGVCEHVKVTLAEGTTTVYHFRLYEVDHTVQLAGFSGDTTVVVKFDGIAKELDEGKWYTINGVHVKVSEITTFYGGPSQEIKGAILTMGEFYESCPTDCGMGMCDDSDYGKDYYSFGQVFWENGTNMDTCIDTDTLKEYYCYKGVKSEEHVCPNGCERGVCKRSITPSVDLKVNGVDNIPSIPYNSIFTLSWKAVGVGGCTGYGHYVPVVDGTLWTDHENLPSSGSMELYARHEKEGYMSKLELGLQCYDSQGNSIIDEVVIPVTSLNQTCTDSDGGKNFYVYGYTTGKDEQGNVGSHYDVCSESVQYPNYVNEGPYLSETYCENGISKRYVFECPNGCKNGVCVKEGTPDLIVENLTLEYSETKIAGIPSYIYTGYVKNVGDGPAKKSWVTVTINPSQVQRTEGGASYVTYDGATFPVPSNDLVSGDTLYPGQRERFSDYFNPTKEGYVEISVTADVYDNVAESNEYNNDLSRTFYVKKVFDLNQTCTDSDGGRSYYVRGKVTGLNPDNSLVTKEDTCVSMFVEGEMRQVIEEYYCKGDYVTADYYTCPNGCKDGACIKGKEPYCDAIGTRSEGWYQYGRLIKYVSCDGCYAVCKAAGTRSEGWYSSCDGSLIKYEECAEECTDGETRVCGSNVGECKKGKQICVNGTWSECMGAVGPRPEVCDGLDNDCDGIVDDNCEKCPAKIDMEFNKEVYYPGDYFQVTVKIYDKDGNLMPNHMFYVYNERIKRTSTFYTDSNGVYSSNSTIPFDPEYAGSWAFTAYVSEEGCPYISDHETIFINISSSCGDGYCDESEKELVCSGYCPECTPEIAKKNPEACRCRTVCHVKCPKDCTPKCGNGICDTEVCSEPGCPIPENVKNCQEDCEKPNYCGSQSSDPNCVCPEGYVKESFQAPCEGPVVEVVRITPRVTGGVVASEKECSDSDGGRNYYVKGVTEGIASWGKNLPPERFEDYCRRSNTAVQEMYCGDDGYVYQEIFTCPNGCENGRCVGEGETITCKPGQMIGDANDDGQVTPGDIGSIMDIYSGRISKPKNICCVDLNGDGSVTPADAQYAWEIYFEGKESPGYCEIWCSYDSIIGDADADGAVTERDATIIHNVYLGRITLPDNICCLDVNNDGSVTPADAQLVYDIISGEKPKERCKGICTDSDGGINYYVKGTTTGYWEGSWQSVTDFCYNASVVEEYFCDGINVVKTGHMCPNGCKNGACIGNVSRCAKEGEYTSGPVPPEYQYGCCEGLEGFDTHPEIEGDGLLCYNPKKGIPVCKFDGTRSEGWYYSKTGELLRYEDCSQKMCTYYRCVPERPKLYLYTDKQVYDIGEGVKMQTNYFRKDEIEKEGIRVSVRTPYGRSYTLVLTRVCEPYSECPPCKPGGYCPPCTSIEKCKFEGVFTETKSVGRYYVRGGDGLTIRPTSFLVYDYSLLRRYLILEDIDGFDYQTASITTGPENITVYTATYGKGGSIYTVVVADFEEREKLKEFLNNQFEQTPPTVKRMDGDYVYILTMGNLKYYVWTHRALLVIVAESPYAAQIGTAKPFQAVPEVQPKIIPEKPKGAESTAEGDFLTGMITAMQIAGGDGYCGIDSVDPECRCKEGEVKESFTLCTGPETCKTHYRCKPTEPKELIFAYLDKYPSDVMSTGTECERKGGYCIPSQDSCKEGFEESSFACRTSSEKCCIKEVEKEDFIEIVFKLESIRIRMDRFERKANAVADYYESVGDSERARKYREVAGMFTTAKRMVDDIIAKIREHLENPDVIRDEIKKDIKDLRRYINSILEKLVY